MTEQKLQGSRSQPWPGPFPSPAAPSDTPPVVAQDPQCPHSHTMSRFRELTPKSPPQEAVPPFLSAPDLQPLRLATTGQARPPAGKSSHLGESILSHTHLTVHATAHNPKPATDLDLWLGNQTWSFSAKCQLYSNRMPIRVQENKSNKRLLQLMLVFLSTSHSQAYFNLPFLTLYWRNEPGKQFFK